MVGAVLAIVVFAWSLFGNSEEPKSETAAQPQPAASEPAAPAPVPPVDTEKLVQEAVDKAVKELAAKVAQQTADANAAAAKAAEAKADKQRAEDLARADKQRAEDLARADKLRAEEKVAEEKRRAEEKENAKVEKAEREESLKQIDTRVFRLHHASAAEVAQNLNTMWNGEFGQTWKVKQMAIAFPEPNSVVVTAPRLILNACEKAVAELDVEPQQVYIEARFVELANNASHKLGIDWSMLDGMKGSLSLDAGYNERKMEGVATYNSKDNTYTLSSAAANIGSQDANLSHLNATLGMSELYVVLRALESSEDARTFSNPKIIVSSGKKATVDMTKKYPNVNIAVKKTFNTSGESTDLDMKMAAIPGEDKMMFAKEAFFSWGISLDVTPRIATNGLINVSIVPTISDCTEFVTADNGSSSDTSAYSSRYPIINVQRLITEFSMASGTTAVIGGLSRTVEQQVDSGIPWLRDWWWIGPRLFGSKQRVKQQREIIVFVTVGLVDPKNIAKDAGLPKNAVLGRQYTDDVRREPGDRRRTRPEGMQSLDLRSLEEQYADPRRTNRVPRVSWDEYKPFTKDPNYKYDKETER